MAVQKKNEIVESTLDSTNPVEVDLNLQENVKEISTSEPIDLYINKRLTKMQLPDIRKVKHLTQKDVSEATGLSLQCISDIESLTSGNPTLKSLIKYLDCLGYEIAFQRKSI